MCQIINISIEQPEEIAELISRALSSIELCDPLSAKLVRATYEWLKTEKPAVAAHTLSMVDYEHLMYNLLNNGPLGDVRELPHEFTTIQAAAIASSLIGNGENEYVLCEWVSDILKYANDHEEDVQKVISALDPRVIERVFSFGTRAGRLEELLRNTVCDICNSKTPPIHGLAGALSPETFAQILREIADSSLFDLQEVIELFLVGDNQKANWRIKEHSSRAFDILGDGFIQDLLLSEKPQTILAILPFLSETAVVNFLRCYDREEALAVLEDAEFLPEAKLSIAKRFTEADT